MVVSGRGYLAFPTSVGMPVISPAAICCLICSTAAMSAFGTFGLTLPIPTPSSLRPKVALPPRAFEAWFINTAHDAAALDRVAAALPYAARAAAQAAPATTGGPTT